MDSYKGSCSAQRAGTAIARGIQKVMPDAQVVNFPVADGGEGTVDAMIAGGRGEMYECRVLDPLCRERIAKYGVMGNGVAVLEMSAASGLTCLDPKELDPVRATTYGTGQMILDALKKGYRKIILGLGGSATNDGGAGMAQALGVSLRDAQGRELAFGGAALAQLHTIDARGIHPLVRECEIICAADVKNVLCGENGATHVYGPQKGVTQTMEPILEDALRHYGTLLSAHCGQNVFALEGGGAAGGLGAGLYAFCGARFCSGIDTVLDLLAFDAALEDADIVITGEGHMDGQTINGKVPVGVARRAKKCGGIPVIALVGGADDMAQAVYVHGIDGIFAIADKPMDMRESYERVEILLEKTAEALARTIDAVIKSETQA